MDKPRKSIKHNDNFEETGSSPVKSEIDAVARHSGLVNEDFIPVSLTGGTTNFHCTGGNNPPSSLEDGNNIKEHRSRHLERRRLTPMFDPGSIASGCTHERSESTSSCTVVGASFCLGNLSMVNRCNEFGGGPGIDRDGELVSGKFCGIGARYRVGTKLIHVDLKESSGTLDRALPGKESNLDETITAVEDEISKTEATTKKMIHSIVSLGLSNKIYALEIAKTLLLPRVPGLAEKVINTWTEFEENVQEVTDSESLIENVALFKKSRVDILLKFDIAQFLDLLSLPDEEASTSFQSTLNEWNDVLKDFLAIFLPSSERREHKNQ